MLLSLLLQYYYNSIITIVFLPLYYYYSIITIVLLLQYGTAKYTMVQYCGIGRIGITPLLTTPITPIEDWNTTETKLNPKDYAGTLPKTLKEEFFILRFA